MTGPRTRAGWALPALALLALLFALSSIAASRPIERLLEPPGPAAGSSWPARIAAVGVVEPLGDEVAVSAAVAGVVSAVHVMAGEAVTEGQPLLTLAAPELEAELGLRRAELGLACARRARVEAGPRPEEAPGLEARVRAAAATREDARARLERRADARLAPAVTDEERTTLRLATARAEAEHDVAAAALALHRAGAWGRALAVARAEVEVADAAVARVEAELGRRTVRAPLAGEVLRVDVRPGEALSGPALILGRAGRQVRAAVDEHDAWRLVPGARAEGCVAGAPGLRAPLRWMRIEPRAGPKLELTRAPGERVDTRVVLVLFALEPGALPVRVGQRVDVFIEAPTWRTLDGR